MILSPKVKIFYLILLIFFSIGIYLYLLEEWGIIQLKDYIPFLEKEPPKIDTTKGNELLIAKDKLEKEKELLEEEKIKINELKAELDKKKQELESKEKEIIEQQTNIEEQKKSLQEKENARKEKNKMIEDMARRLNAMPPQNVIEIIQGWKNIDIVDVFLKMEQLAEEEGTPSIVPFLLSQLPAERASIITSLMLDEGIREDIFKE
ncbi:MAG: periplasmic-type flagellar collar protein FlbB [Leptonema sp. (in: bacteria)]